MVREGAMTTDSLASYFGVRPEIEAFIPDLLVDFFELGSYPQRIVDMLRRAGLSGDPTSVIDLGCGKGAVALAVARELGARVHGVDALEPFVLEARRRSRSAGLEAWCSFECADLREVVKRDQLFDVVLYVSVGEVLGDMAQSVAALRELAKPGGLIVIDDGYTSAPTDFPGYETMTSHEEALRQLACHGDEIIEECVYDASEVVEMNRVYQQRIEDQAARLSAAHPELAEAFAAYVEQQRQECELLNEHVVCATWLVRRCENR